MLNQREEGGPKTVAPRSNACLAAGWPSKPPARLIWEVLLMPLFLGTSLGPLWAMEHRQATDNLGLNLRLVSNSHTPCDLYWPRFPHHRTEG